MVFWFIVAIVLRMVWCAAKQEYAAAKAKAIIEKQKQQPTWVDGHYVGNQWKR